MANLTTIAGTDIIKDSRTVINGNFSAVNSELSTATAHLLRSDNPHGVTAAQVGLGAVDNTADADKPLSSALVSALAGKAPVMANAAALAKVSESGGLPLWDGATWPGGSGGSGGVGRELLTAARTYYVRVDGDDANDGLTDTAEGAFLTIQAAANAAMMLDLGIYSVTIQVGAGTYASVVDLKTLIGAGTVTIQGAGLANTIIAPAANCIRVYADGWTVRGMKLAPSAGQAIIVFSGATLTFLDIDFAAISGGFHINCSSGGSALAAGNYTISGGALAHWICFWGGVIQVEGRTVTILGNPAFTVFAQCERLGGLRVNANTFVGTATGSRYLSKSNAIISTNGGSTTYLPGSTAGSTTTGGIYE